MEFNMLSQLIPSLAYLLAMLIFVSFVKSAWFKGIMGEAIVNIMLKLFLPKNQYTLIKNVTLPTQDGTTQIDHIVVSEFGLFVIETKNIKGWIFGGAHQKMWTQKIFKHSCKFQNPLHQNYKHTQTLAECLQAPSEHIFSVVVFVGDSTFKTDLPDNVTYAYGCVRYIKSKSLCVFSQEQRVNIINQIESGRLQRGLKTNFQHNRYVKGIVNSKNNDATKQKNNSSFFVNGQTSNQPVCKKCGSIMVLREAKKGKNTGNQFWGCSNFPQCRQVLSLS